MPRSRPNKRDYVTVQLQRMMGKGNKKTTLILDDPATNDQISTNEQQPSQSTTEQKPFRTPSIPSASIANQPDLWRRRDAQSMASEDDTKSKDKVSGATVANNSNGKQDTTLPSIQVEIPDDQIRYPTYHRVFGVSECIVKFNKMVIL